MTENDIDSLGMHLAGSINPKISWMVETDRVSFWCTEKMASAAKVQLSADAMPHKIYRWNGTDLLLESEFPQAVAPVVTGQGDFARSFTPEFDENFLPLLIMLLAVTAIAVAILFFL